MQFQNITLLKLGKYAPKNPENACKYALNNLELCTYEGRFKSNAKNLGRSFFVPNKVYFVI